MAFRKKKIVVTDDSHTFLMYISILLNKMGFHVIPAENGLEALKIVSLMSPDLIMLDIRMSMLDGVKTLRHLKEDEHTSHIPVVIVSADKRKKTIEECRRAGCSGYLVKPVDIGELNDVLQDCLFAPMDRRRKRLRIPYEAEVYLTAKGTEGKYFGVTLSEGGIYLRTKDPLPVGMKVEVTLQVTDGEDLTFKGFVIYIKGLFGDVFTVPPGMAIEFIGGKGEKFRKLSHFIRERLGKEIIDFQDEPVIRVDEM